MFEYQARAVRDAVLAAEADLQPARMAAHTVSFSVFKANIVGLEVADDGSPAGYPREFGDNGLVVMRFDGLDGAPIASWVNFGEHPESLDGYGLTTADYLGSAGAVRRAGDRRAAGLQPGRRRLLRGPVRARRHASRRCPPGRSARSRTRGTRRWSAARG